MNHIIPHSSGVVVPSPQVEMSIRLATLADLPAIDALQKLHHKQLGFFPRGQMEEYLRNGWVVVAEGAGSMQRAAGGADGDDTRSGCAPLLPAAYCPLPTLLGYCASRDRYLKRDELGVIYQLCVDPGAQRKFIGAALLRAVFERAPYGCKLFCCWCAQDIAANYFWESMGFVPLAFRTGGRKGRAATGKWRENARSELAPGPSPHAPSSRIHIFWQKRIAEGDTTTQYWFPSQTGGGAMGEDRLVLPIPPGTRWSDEMPRILPAARHEGTEAFRHEAAERGNPKQIQSAKSKGPKPKASQTAPLARKALGGWGFAPSTPVAPAAPAPARKPRERMKNDPKLIAAARELRDRWLEEVNSGKYLPMANAKYDVVRQIELHHADRPRLLIEQQRAA